MASSARIRTQSPLASRSSARSSSSTSRTSSFGGSPSSSVPQTSSGTRPLVAAAAERALQQASVLRVGLREDHEVEAAVEVLERAEGHQRAAPRARLAQRRRRGRRRARRGPRGPRCRRSACRHNAGAAARGRGADARHVEAEHLLLVLEALAVGPLGGLRQRRLRCAPRPRRRRTGSPARSRDRAAPPRPARARRRGRSRPPRGSRAARRRRRTSPGSRPRAGSRAGRRCAPRSRRGSRRGRPRRASRIALDRALADVLDAGEPEADALATTVKSRVRSRSPIRREDLDPELRARARCSARACRGCRTRW